MPNVSQNLLTRLHRGVLKSQRKMMGRLRGEYVVRNGITFLVVSATKDVFVVSDLATPVGQTLRMGADVFLSKRVRVLKDVEDEEEKVV